MAYTMSRGLIPFLIGLVASLVATAPVWTHAQDLRRAVWDDDVELVKRLLESGTNVNKTYENRHTSIYSTSNPEMVDLLIAHGARLDMRSSATLQTPIEHAAEKVFRDAENRGDWRLIVDKLRTAGAEYTIDTATYLNDIEFVREQLAADASWVNDRREARSVPLRVAARTGRVEICKLLLEHKADPDAFEAGTGYPIIKDAVDHPGVVKLLIQHGANLKRRITWRGGRTGVWVIGDEGTVLHYAVRAGNLESVKLLIAAGLDPTAADDQGQTPLHIAIHFERWNSQRGRASSDYAEIVGYLLESDASLRFSDRKGRTPSALAEEIESPAEIRRLLREAKEERDEKYRRAMFGDE